jgi:siderophore synthetase component
MTLRHGLILEAHGQDLMLALSPDLHPLDRFYYRDFEGLQVDWELRRQHGLSMPANMPNSHAWHETYATWGYNYGQLVWYKLRISLLQYMHCVLAELEQMLRSWQERGILGGARFDEDELTAMFSRKMLELLHELFAVQVPTGYNIHRHLNRFVLQLLRVRKARAAQPVGNRLA